MHLFDGTKTTDPLVWIKDVEQHKRVGEEVLSYGDVHLWVSTVFLGIDHNFENEGSPLLFETMIFECAPDGAVLDWSELYCRRYATVGEARTGHSQIVALLKARKASTVNINQLANDILATVRKED